MLCWFEPDTAMAVADVSIEVIVRTLDRLLGESAAAVVALERTGFEAAIDAVLARLGAALDVDAVRFETIADAENLESTTRVWTRSASMAPSAEPHRVLVQAAGRPVTVLSLGLRGGTEVWPAVEERLQLLADLLTLAVQRGSDMRAVDETRSALTRLSAGMSARAFDDEADVADFEDIIGDSPALRVAQARVQEVAPTDVSVVIQGETGTGKELFARAVHNLSPRRHRPFVRVNCAALPPTLIESELFGHERGAFTGAVSMRQGRFELANTGTLFLDEIGDLPPEVQAKLLRVLQEGEFERVGASQSRKVDVRIVAATHHDLQAAVKEGRFRADLYYRINVFPIALPPLRERVDDITRLAWFFINRRQRALNRKFTRIPPEVLDALQQYEWPGNVRELQNVIERAMIHSAGDTLLLDEGPGTRLPIPSRDAGTLEAVERRHIENALQRCRWRINGAGNAAEVLGINPNTLRFRMKKLGIRRPPNHPGPLGIKRLSA